MEEFINWNSSIEVALWVLPLQRVYFLPLFQTTITVRGRAINNNVHENSLAWLYWSFTCQPACLADLHCFPPASERSCREDFRQVDLTKSSSALNCLYCFFKAYDLTITIKSRMLKVCKSLIRTIFSMTLFLMRFHLNCCFYCRSFSSNRRYIWYD